MDSSYIKKRDAKSISRYRLKKRIHQIEKVLLDLTNGKAEGILDIGTADGRVLAEITSRFSFTKVVGIEILPDFAKIARQKINWVIQAKGECLPLKKDSFGVILATAVIEHIKETSLFLDECFNVLKSEGFLIITLPNPFFDFINGLFVNTYHVQRFTLGKIKQLLKAHNFKIEEATHFMISPFFQFPFETIIEKFFRKIKMDFLLFNQLIVARKL
ncbi:MAG: class I SAM-dependent methyltransferase [Thermodesulfobacteriota bacterium]